MPPFFLEDRMKTLLFYTMSDYTYTAFARFDNVNRKGLNGDEVREATTIIGKIAGVASWNILVGDWNRTHSRFTLKNGRIFHFHPKFNEICAALEREYEQLRGHARYRRDANPLHSEDGTCLPGTSYIYATRKERKYGERISWDGTDELVHDEEFGYRARSHLVVHPGDRTYPELVEEERIARGMPGSGAIYAA